MESRFIFEDLYIPEEHLDEEWEHICGYPKYAISNHGRVYSEISGKILTPTKNIRTGHEYVTLRNEYGKKKQYVHRLVAEGFLDKPKENQKLVRHLDDDPSFNWVSNLAWGTHLDNAHDCINNGHFRYFTEEDILKANKKRARPVTMIDLNTGEEKIFKSQCEASRQLGIRQSDISGVARGKRHRTSHYTFKYAEKGDQNEND